MEIERVDGERRGEAAVLSRTGDVTGVLELTLVVSTPPCREPVIVSPMKRVAVGGAPQTFREHVLRVFLHESRYREQQDTRRRVMGIGIECVEGISSRGADVSGKSGRIFAPRASLPIVRDCPGPPPLF